MTDVGKDPYRSPGSTPLLKQTPRADCPGPRPSNFRSHPRKSPRGEFSSLLWAACASAHSKVLPYVQMEPLVFQFVPIVSSTPLKRASVLCILLLDIYTHWWDLGYTAMVLWFLLSVVHIITSCRALRVEELILQFRGLMIVWGIPGDLIVLPETFNKFSAHWSVSAVSAVKLVIVCFIWRNKKMGTNADIHTSCNASCFVNLVVDLSHQLYNHWTGNSKEESNLVCAGALSLPHREYGRVGLGSLLKKKNCFQGAPEASPGLTSPVVQQRVLLAGSPKLTCRTNSISTK